jgi:hypothetical protein
MMRVSLLLPLCATLAWPVPASAQQVEKDCPAAADCAGVRRAVLDYVEGFYEGDTAKLARSVSRDVRKSGYWRARDSVTYAYSEMPYAEFISYALGVRARNRQAPATAPKLVTLFDVLDQTASARLTAYWGVDYLLLARQNGRWTVTHVLWQSPPR